MLEGRVEHNTLISISVVSCILGAIALTVGLFVFYGCERLYNVAACCAGSGGVLIISGMVVGQYTKWRSER